MHWQAYVLLETDRRGLSWYAGRENQGRKSGLWRGEVQLRESLGRTGTPLALAYLMAALVDGSAAATGNPLEADAVVRGPEPACVACHLPLVLLLRYRLPRQRQVKLMEVRVLGRPALTQPAAHGGNPHRPFTM